LQAVGDQTRFAQIVALMQSASTTKPITAALADRLAKPFLVGVLLAAALSCLWWWQTDPERALMVAVAVLVVTCPCALSLATPAAMLAAAGNMARSGVLVRNLRALEALSQVDVVVFDKTGTLTEEGMAIGRVEARSGVAISQVVQMAAALASHSLHPVSRALCAAARLPAYQAANWVSDSVREQVGHGLEAEAHQHGLSSHLRLGSIAFCGLDFVPDSDLRVHLSDAHGWLASFEMREQLRPEAIQAVADLKRAGIQVQLLSGDRPESVQHIAQTIGIQHARGACSPSEKLAALRDLQAKGHRVLMVGDGLNDGPVLAGAQVSIAFGQAVPLAQAQSDFVVMGERLGSVVHAVQLARKTMSVVHQNLWWALLYNAACVPLAVAGLLPAWLAGLGMASSSLVVIINALRLNR
jgi:Cu2+-exporting ATPase